MKRVRFGVRALVFGAHLLSLGTCAALIGCGGEATNMPGNPDGGTPFSCQSDKDCELQTTRRACQRGSCVAATCPAGTTYVGSGTFTRGCDASTSNCDADAQPAHQVTLSKPFCISITELTVAQYRSCVDKQQCAATAELRCSPDNSTWTAAKGPFESWPMNCLLHSEAAAACRSLGGRLPTEAEWERAARGYDARLFPWGRQTPIGCADGANWVGLTEGCPGYPWPASTSQREGSMLYSSARAVDQSGNVWEWTADAYAPDAYKSCGPACTDPKEPATDGGPVLLRVRRGGSYRSAQFKELRTHARDFHTPELARSDDNGVRCAFDAVLPP